MLTQNESKEHQHPRACSNISDISNTHMESICSFSQLDIIASGESYQNVLRLRSKISVSSNVCINPSSFLYYSPSPRVDRKPLNTQPLQLNFGVWWQNCGTWRLSKRMRNVVIVVESRQGTGALGKTCFPCWLGILSRTGFLWTSQEVLCLMLTSPGNNTS